MSKEIISVLEYLSAKIGIHIDWTSKNVLPYINELFQKYIQYEIASSTVLVVLAILLIFVDIMLIKYCKKSMLMRILPDPIPLTILMILILTFTATLILFIQGEDILKSIYFPELQLYEYISRIIQRK